MNRNMIGITASFLYILFVIGFATLLKKKYHASSEITRKTVHILSGNWIFISHYFFDSLEFAVIAPACFILINYLSLKYRIISVIEREPTESGEVDSYGTVYYSVSTLLLVVFDFMTKSVYPSYLGLLIMAYGDGFAALIGQRYGKRNEFFKDKTLEGSLTLFVISFFLSNSILYFTQGKILFLESFFISVLAMILEFKSFKGSDNITLPIGVGIYSYFIVNFPVATMVASLVNLLVVGFAYYKKSLTHDGVLFAFFTGVVLYALGDFPMYAALLLFFIAGSFTGIFKNRYKEEGEKLHKRTGARNWVQVIANSFPAVLILCISHFAGLPMEHSLLAGISCLAGSCADTFASEFGMLSSHEPVSILTLKPLKRGLSGGVSIMGVFAALAGSMLIASCIFFYPQFGVFEFFTVSMLGFISSLLDSVIGASAQVKYIYEDGNISERSDLEGEIVAQKGFYFINNDVVNFLSVGLITLATYYISVLK